MNEFMNANEFLSCM